LCANNPAASPAPEPNTTPTPKPLPKSNLFLKPKPARRTTVTPQLLETRAGKATRTEIIDDATALRVEKASLQVAKKERSAKGKPTFFGTTGAAKRGRFTATEDGKIRMRRKKGLEMEVVGGKRKRVDVCEESNKRVATGGGVMRL
jgi:hypothetical protein